MPSQAICSQLLLGLYSCVSLLYSTYLIVDPPRPWALGGRPSRLGPEPGLPVVHQARVWPAPKDRRQQAGTRTPAQASAENDAQAQTLPHGFVEG